jgi:hypothetical protein
MAALAAQADGCRARNAKALPSCDAVAELIKSVGTNVSDDSLLVTRLNELLKRTSFARSPPDFFQRAVGQLHIATRLGTRNTEFLVHDSPLSQTA